MEKQDKILVIGACGQLGTRLTAALREQYGWFNVIAADKIPTADILLDVLNYEQLETVVRDCKVTQIYLLAAILSANGEKNSNATWNLNIKSLLYVLEIAREYKLDKVFWPSSIAVFGPGSPKYNCPQETSIQPNTVYGISKRTGEYWCNYYFEKYGVDVRSLRFPGLISSTAPPGIGTTDYAVDIFHQALTRQQYTCFLNEDNCLPMMYMPDAVRATLELMNAPKADISIRTSYNLAAMSFAPCDIAAAIKKQIPEFTISYEPDHREVIAKSWPASIRDDEAKRDWGWKPLYDLESMTIDMMQKLSDVKRKPLPVLSPQLDYPDFPVDDYEYVKAI